MLVLSRKVDESIVIRNDITVRILRIEGSRVRLGIEAPRNVGIRRSEIEIDLSAEVVEDVTLTDGSVQ